MTRGTDPTAQPGTMAGCLRSAIGLAGLVVLAPFAIVVRSLRAWRRGPGLRLECRRGELAVGDGPPLARIDTTADVPSAAVEAFRRRLTETVVRVAEALRRPDDVYHLLARDPSAEETDVLPVGPQIQELAERLHLVLGRPPMAGRTAVWMALPRSRRVAEFVDPFDYDPEAAGEPERLLAGSGMRWGMATGFAPGGPSVVFRIVLYVPADAAPTIEGLLEKGLGVEG
jgi:hypothetical protein